MAMTIKTVEYGSGQRQWLEDCCAKARSFHVHIENPQGHFRRPTNKYGEYCTHREGEGEGPANFAVFFLGVATVECHLEQSMCNCPTTRGIGEYGPQSQELRTR